MKRKTLKQILEEKGIDLNLKRVEMLDNLSSMKQKVLADDWVCPEIAPDAITNLSKVEDKCIESLEKTLKAEEAREEPKKSNFFSGFKFT